MGLSESDQTAGGTNRGRVWWSQGGASEPWRINRNSVNVKSSSGGGGKWSRLQFWLYTTYDLDVDFCAGGDKWIQVDLGWSQVGRGLVKSTVYCEILASAVGLVGAEWPLGGIHCLEFGMEPRFDEAKWKQVSLGR